MSSKYFGNPKTFCIVTGKEYALSCLREAYAHKYSFDNCETAELCPFDKFFDEYPETPEKPHKLTFRFTYNKALNKYTIGWADEKYYRSETVFPVYFWEDVIDALAPESPEFLDLL